VACDATPHDRHGGLKPGSAYVISPASKLVACTPREGPNEGMVVVRIARSEVSR
jgi:hypothetical protein